jgi:hypothetical protein
MAIQTSVLVNGAEGGRAYISAGQATGNYGRQVTISAEAEAGWRFVRFQTTKTPVQFEEIAVGGYSTTVDSICYGNLQTELSRWLWTDGRSYYTDANGTQPAPYGIYGAGSGQYYTLDAGGLNGPFPCGITQPPATPAPAALSYGYCNCGNGCVDGYAPNRPCPSGCVPCTPPAPTPSPIAPTPPPITITPAPISNNDECDIFLQNCPSGFTCQIVNVGYTTFGFPIPASRCVAAPPPAPAPTPAPTPAPVFSLPPVGNGGGPTEVSCASDFDCQDPLSGEAFNTFRCINNVCVRNDGIEFAE